MVHEWLDLWRARPVQLHSPMDPDTAAHRLREGLVTSFWTNLTVPGYQVRGQAYRDEIRLRLSRPGRRNSFRSVLRGRLSAAPDGGCVLSGSVGWHPAVRVFTAAWLAGVGAIGLLGVAATMVAIATHDWAALPDRLPAILVPTLMWAFGAGLVFLGGRLGQREERYLIQWLRQGLRSR